MKAEIKVLVTGAGSLLGQGIIRALRASLLRVCIVAADPSPLSAGLYWADSAHLIPMAHTEAYLPCIEEILRVERPDAVLVGTDVELGKFAMNRERLEREYSTSIIVSSPEVIAIADDKWMTYQFLRAKGFDYPESCLAGGENELIEKVGFPLVVKPRVGARSVGVNLVRDPVELRAAVSAGDNVIIQECVGTPGTEYTAGGLYFDGQCDASIVMRRELRDGNTYRAFVESYPKLNGLVRTWTEALKPHGPANFQFRLVEGCAKVFEINVRFSGTTPLRASAGFNEVEMTLRRILGGERVSQPTTRPITILRHWSETIMESDKLLSSAGDNAPAILGARSVAASPAPGEFRVIGTAQNDEWMAVLRRVGEHDFHHLPQYHRCAEERGEGEAHLFTWREGEHVIALPLLLRAINEVPGLEIEPGHWKDATSVYGYAGPVATHPHPPELVLTGFRSALSRWLREAHVITVFSRLHPLLSQGSMLAGLGECVPGGQTVSIDLTASSEAQTAHYRSDHLRDIVYLRKLGVTCIHDQEGRYLEAFIEMYESTMRRVGADSGYFFERNYFDLLTSDPGTSVHLFVCLFDGKPISAGMVTTANGIVQGHLSGSVAEYRKLASKKLLIDTVRQWAMERGYKAFHLGGGVGAREDSLFAFKAGFSNRRHEFSTWRWVLEPAIYADFCRATGNDEAVGATPETFFPLYRAPARPESPVLKNSSIRAT